MYNENNNTSTLKKKNFYKNQNRKSKTVFYYIVYPLIVFIIGSVIFFYFEVWNLPQANLDVILYEPIRNPIDQDTDIQLLVINNIGQKRAENLIVKVNFPFSYGPKDHYIQNIGKIKDYIRDDYFLKFTLEEMPPDDFLYVTFAVNIHYIIKPGDIEISHSENKFDSNLINFKPTYNR